MIKKKKFKNLNLPNRALSNFDLLRYAEELKIPYFRGVYMRNALPINGVKFNESGIVNLDDYNGFGSHWTAYKKRGNYVLYFDSFGNLRPPVDLMEYFGVDEVHYNYKNYQNYDTFNCGHLCLEFSAEKNI